ncbi:MAG: hypothetical protein ICV56_04325 [Nitrososphaeraceae archaeon]|nr:hypothetical protein [Nitrososphaeraceae archaeon]
MSLSTNRALVKSFVEEVFNSHNLSAIEKYLAGQGKEGFKQFLNEFFTAFPRQQVVPDDQSMFNY